MGGGQNRSQGCKSLPDLHVKLLSGLLNYIQSR